VLRKSKFSIVTHWISDLGDSEAKTFIPYNLAIIFYSIFNFFLIGKLRLFFPNSIQSEFAIVLYCVSSLSLILFLIFPFDRNYKGHRTLFSIYFLSILLALILTFLQISKTQETPSITTFLLSSTIVEELIFLFSFIKLHAKYKKIPRTLVDIQIKEKSLLIRNVCLLEWVFFFLLICSQITIAFLI